MRVAVLGAGIQGVCTALELARRGIDVHLFDQDATPLNRASLRAEGKIHLGFVYANDPTDATAELMLEGALRFRPLIERFTDGAVTVLTTSRRFDYLVAPDTQVGVDRLTAHYDRLEARYRERIDDEPGLDYLGARPPVLVEGMTPEALDRFSPDAVVAGFATAERTLHPPSFASQLSGALAASSVQFRPLHRVDGATRTASGFVVEGSCADGPWSLDCDQVVNALWDGRLAVDATMGVAPDRPWLYRMKYRVLVHLPAALQTERSVTVVLGPYGDVVVHRDGTGYVSWYPECMNDLSDELAPPAAWEAPCRGSVDAAKGAALARRALKGIEPWFPGITAAVPFTVDAGVIFAWGATDIDDAGSELHQRSAIGVESFDGYHSVNTGKLTTAPLFALDVADRITG